MVSVLRAGLLVSFKAKVSLIHYSFNLHTGEQGGGSDGADVEVAGGASVGRVGRKRPHLTMLERVNRRILNAADTRNGRSLCMYDVGLIKIQCRRSHARKSKLTTSYHTNSTKSFRCRHSDSRKQHGVHMDGGAGGGIVEGCPLISDGSRHSAAQDPPSIVVKTSTRNSTVSFCMFCHYFRD